MKDRNVEHPDYFRLEKVPGTTDIFKVTPTPGTVYEEGDLLNKSTLLTDDTAALMGLDENAVPDDALSLLGRFNSGLGNDYMWEVLLPETNWETHGPISFGFQFEINSPLQLLVGDSFSANPETGLFEIPNAVQVNVTQENYSSTINSLRGKYAIKTAPSSSANGKSLYYFWPDCNVSGVQLTSYFTVTYTKITESYEIRVDKPLIKYVNSPDPDAYPPSEPDGFEYVPLGQVGKTVQIVAGSYIGTGAFGSDNKNSLTVEFDPKLIIVHYNRISFSMQEVNPLIWLKGVSSNKRYYDADIVYVTAIENGISWFAKDASLQLNNSGQKYYYLAIG